MGPRSSLGPGELAVACLSDRPDPGASRAVRPRRRGAGERGHAGSHGAVMMNYNNYEDLQDWVEKVQELNEKNHLALNWGCTRCTPAHLLRLQR